MILTCKRSSVLLILKPQTEIASTPAWRFQYNADWDNTRLYPASGAYHGVEFNMLFGESAEITGIAESDALCQLKEKMRSAWGAFIADPQHGLEALG